MSIQGLRRFLIGGPVLKAVLYLLIFVFIVGLAAIFAPNSGLRQSEEERMQGAVNSSDVIAKVNGKSLTRGTYEKAYVEIADEGKAAYAQRGMSLSVGDLKDLRLAALQGAINQQLLTADAAAKGVRVSKRDVRQRIAQMVDLELAQLKQLAKGGELEQRFAQIYTQITNTPEQTMSERRFRKWLTGYLQERHADQVQSELLSRRLREKVTPRPAVTEEQLLESFDQFTLRVISVVLNPPGKPARTDEQARARAQELLARIRQGADFAQLATTESDNPRAKQDGGLHQGLPLSLVPPDWQKPLAALKEGEVVPEPVKDSTGYTLIKLEKRARVLPKDFEKNKPQQMDRLAAEQQSQAWSQYQQELLRSAKIQLLDPELLGYQALRINKPDQAIANFKKAAEQAESIGPAGAASVYYQLATHYAAKNDWQKAVSAYERADDFLSREESGLSGSRTETLMGLAHAYQKVGKNEDALIWYRAASEAADNPTVHQQLLSIFQQIGDKSDVTGEQEWLANFNKQQAAQREAQRKVLEAQQKAAAAKAPAPGAPQPAPTPQTGQPTAPATGGKPATAPPAKPGTATKPSPPVQQPAPAGKPAAPAPKSK